MPEVFVQMLRTLVHGHDSSIIILEAPGRIAELFVCSSPLTIFVTAPTFEERVPHRTTGSVCAPIRGRRFSQKGAAYEGLNTARRA